MTNPQLKDLRQHKNNQAADQPFTLANSEGFVIVNSADPNHSIVSVNNSMSKPKMKMSRKVEQKTSNQDWYSCKSSNNQETYTSKNNDLIALEKTEEGDLVPHK